MGEGGQKVQASSYKISSGDVMDGVVKKVSLSSLSVSNLPFKELLHVY